MIGLANYVGRVSIRIEENRIPATVERIQKRWNELIPYLAFDYFRFDVTYDRQCKVDHELRKVARVVMSLAIFIGCLGFIRPHFLVGGT